MQLRAVASMLKTVTIELEDKTLQALQRLARQTDRSIGDLVYQAVRDYLEVQEWQHRKIAAGIAAADVGEFATEEELARVVTKYSTPE